MLISEPIAYIGNTSRNYRNLEQRARNDLEVICEIFRLCASENKFYLLANNAALMKCSFSQRSCQSGQSNFLNDSKSIPMSQNSIFKNREVADKFEWEKWQESVAELKPDDGKNETGYRLGCHSEFSDINDQLWSSTSNLEIRVEVT